MTLLSKVYWLALLSAFCGVNGLHGAAPLMIVGFSVANGQAAIAFNSEAGVGYTVEKTSSLPSGTWTTVATINGNGSTMIVTSSAIGSQGYYRIRSPDHYSI